MRILVQDSGSRAFFDGVGWGEDLEQAMDFETIAQAEAFCREQNFPGALIVVKSKHADNDVTYPVGPRGALLVSRPPTTKIKSLY
jgi:hypothetical protein